MKSELVQAAKILSGAIIAAAGVLGAAIAKIDFAIFVGLVASCVGLGLLIVGWGNFSVRFPQIQTFPLAANARPQEIKPNGASGSLGKET